MSRYESFCFHFFYEKQGEDKGPLPAHQPINNIILKHKLDFLNVSCQLTLFSL